MQNKLIPILTNFKEQHQRISTETVVISPFKLLSVKTPPAIGVNAEHKVHFNIKKDRLFQQKELALLFADHRYIFSFGPNIENEDVVFKVYEKYVPEFEKVLFESNGIIAEFNKKQIKDSLWKQLHSTHSFIEENPSIADEDIKAIIESLNQLVN